MFMLNDIKMIYKEVTNMIIDTLKRFKGVNYVNFAGDDLINQQNNHKTLQCWVDDVSFHQFNLTQNIAKVEYQIYILGFPTGESGNTVLDIQDQCYDVALYTLAYLDIKEQFKGIISVYDYSILTLSHYSDDSSAGVKLSLVLTIPNGVNLCELDDHFGEPYPDEPDHEIDINTDEIGDIDINPIHLPRNREC